ncbi:hypothetical protein ABZZ20_18290 [Streptomyces sp. NPDC006430]|uniref:hypothetical protein n=1 Tax=Streptomyces sp. NPDC006430 TaxID=3154299 RepID=UPI0033B5B0E7
MTSPHFARAARDDAGTTWRRRRAALALVGAALVTSIPLAMIRPAAPAAPDRQPTVPASSSPSTG